eukprot:1494-Heterococcus_DN1.PRE.1
MLRVLQSSSSGANSSSGTAKLRRTPLYEPSEQQAGAAEAARVAISAHITKLCSEGLAHADEVLAGESADSTWLNNHEEDVPFFRTFLNTQATVV